KAPSGTAPVLERKEASSQGKRADDHQALAAAHVEPAAADPLAVHVVQHGSAAHALFVADDLAALVHARHEKRELRELFAGAAVAHEVLVADDMTLGVLQL